jgi:hypothetical protein
MLFHQVRSVFTANAEVSWSIPTNVRRALTTGTSPTNSDTAPTAGPTLE